MEKLQLQAHRGVCVEYPENTMSAYMGAVIQGYKVIEIDPAVTVDGVFVCMHDKTINRTGRKKDGSIIEDEMLIADITYEEAVGYDYGLWFSNKFKGERIPKLEDVLNMAVEHNVLLKIDNKFRRFSDENIERFFELTASYLNNVAFTCYDMDMVLRVISKFPDANIHYDGVVDDEILENLSKTVKSDKLTVWVPLECSLTFWVKVAFADAKLCEKIKKFAKLGVWILSEYEDLEIARSWGADFVETNGKLKPCNLKGVRVDLHNHTKYSHDGMSEISDLCDAEVAAGNKIVAITDHYDVLRYDTVDHKTQFENIKDNIKEVSPLYKDKLEILYGIEAGEGVWYPDVTDEFIHQYDFDVVIGSVHSVRTPKTNVPFSGIDFSGYTYDDIMEYMKCYFDDVEDMLNNTEMDVLAHLVSPLKYINGKYGKEISSRIFEDRIVKVLEFIIKHGIILEVNTSSIGSSYDEFMPEEWIIRRFREMGGYLISVASDSHCPSKAALGFDRAYETLKEIGFENVFYVKNRYIIQITL